jgi:hypothetical protein
MRRNGVSAGTKRAFSQPRSTKSGKSRSSSVAPAMNHARDTLGATRLAAKPTA